MVILLEGRRARASVACASALLLTACVSEGPAPPRVDLPEPGSCGSARVLPRASTTSPTGRSANAGSGVRVHAAPSTTLPPAAPGAASSYPAQDASAYPSPAAASALPIPEAAPPTREFTVDPQHQPATSGNSAVNTLLAQADSARRGGDLDAAIAAAERALRIAPADPAVYYELAVLRLARGEADAAVQLAQKGLSHGPDAVLRLRLEELLARARSA